MINHLLGFKASVIVVLTLALVVLFSRSHSRLSTSTIRSTISWDTDDAYSLVLSNSTNLKLQLRTDEPEPYDIDRWVVFHGFETTNIQANNPTYYAGYPPGYDWELLYKKVVEESLLWLMKALQASYLPMLDQWQKDYPDHPSFLRYFRATKKEASVVYNMLSRISQAIGDPYWDSYREQGCLVTPKIHFYYLDPSPERKACTDFRPAGDYPEDARILMAHYLVPKTPGIVPGIVFCEQWFRHYRGLADQEHYEKYITDFIEYGYPDPTIEPSFSTSFILLHGESLSWIADNFWLITSLTEFMHYPLLYPPDWRWKPHLADWDAIPDLFVKDVDNVIEPAYGARRAWCINHPEQFSIYDADLTRSLQEYGVDPDWYSPVSLKCDKNTVICVTDVHTDAQP